MENRNDYRLYPGQTKPPYFGKVRIISEVGKFLVAETTNNISAFDVVLPVEIPRKGAALNNISAQFFKCTENIIPNCLVSVPHPRFAIWKKTEPFKFEMIVRGYNTGSFYRNYYGKPNPWGYEFVKEIKKDAAFNELLLTPTTKAEQGQHDADISREEILANGLATIEEYAIIEKAAQDLFNQGTFFAQIRGLILVDTKYEFGKDKEGNILLIDEVHTPDSSRYWHLNEYEERLAKGEEQKQLSKEFVRQWLIENNFQGRPDDIMPEISPEKVIDISERYLELYEELIGELYEETLLSWDDDTDPYDKICEAVAAVAALTS